MCHIHIDETVSTEMIRFGVKVFVLLWIIFVPIVMTARLEKIIKLLEKK